MKLLLLGMVGCGGDDAAPPPKTTQAKLDAPSAQAADAKAVTALEPLGVKIERN